MGDDKVLRIELARERSHENGYYYSTLDLPAEEHEIRDALQRARISGAHLNHHDLSMWYCSGEAPDSMCCIGSSAEQRSIT